MNILSLPCTNGVHSHLIPLFVLHQRYFRRMPGVNNSFLLPKRLHEQYEKSGVPVVPVDISPSDGNEVEEMVHNEDRQRLNTQYLQYKSKIASAFEMTNADIIIDSNEISSTLIAEKNGVPRISMYRTGLFRSIDQRLRNPAHMHSMEKTNAGKGFDASMILRPHKKLSQLHRKHLKSTYLSDDVDYFMGYLHAKTKLIPGIPSLEVLPDDIEHRDSYFYTGPLLVEDNPTDELSEELGQFFERNQHTKIVFITTGLIDQDDIEEMMIYLLTQGYAVISTRKLTNPEGYEDQFFQNAFLPLNYVCATVDLIIHQCGCGMYHYPLLHQKPTITIGTQCYDREDVALRLQALKISKHVPSRHDDENYLDVFARHVEAFEKGELVDRPSLEKIKEEIYRTMLDFDMDEALAYTISTTVAQ